jgi:hypothetical protein
MALEEPEQQDDQDEHDKQSDDAHDLRPPFLVLCATQSGARTGGHRSVPGTAFQERFDRRPPHLTRATTAQNLA